MNQGTVTAGVVKAAESAYTATVPRVRRVQFTIAVTDSRGQRAFWNCEAEGDPHHLDFIEGQAQPGRGVKIDYELATRPFMKSGVHVGEVRFLRVLNIEFGAKGAEAVEDVPA